MNISKVTITNYKSLNEVELDFSSFVCLIGENNAGKSSILQSITLFFSGGNLSKEYFYNESKEVIIEIKFEAISESDLNRLAEEHKEKIRAIIKNNELVLARIYNLEGKSSIKYKKMIPEETRFSDEEIDNLVKGQKPGQKFVDKVVSVFPELLSVLNASMKQDDIRLEIDQLAEKIPSIKKKETYRILPTGIDKSISAFLPEPIYIPAVKDLKDDIKTTESTPFGKILNILLKSIEPELVQEKDIFQVLNTKLNRIITDDGAITDTRLKQLQNIERTIQKYINESFKNVKVELKIPPPQIKTILSSATIFADDGVLSAFELKGDGLKRAIIFSIFRTYIELHKTDVSDTVVKNMDNMYILLFEEPELYLHPQAQKILFESLGFFSQKNTVVVTTHSPMFFGPKTTKTFIKVRKTIDLNISSKPFAMTYNLDMTDTSLKDQFQIINFENNNIAFFSEKVVLVEGDSDLIVFPHIAKLINSDWDVTYLPFHFTKIGGKGNIQKYRDFFIKFNTKIYAIVDLDFILEQEFLSIKPTEGLIVLRNSLIAEIDKCILVDSALNSEKIQKAQTNRSLFDLWKKCKDKY